MVMGLQHHRVYQKDRLGTPESPVVDDGIELGGCLQEVACPYPWLKQGLQCGDIHLHSRDLLRWQENQQYLVGSVSASFGT